MASPPMRQRPVSRAMTGLIGSRALFFLLAFCALAGRAGAQSADSRHECAGAPRFIGLALALLVHRAHSWDPCPAGRWLVRQLARRGRDSGRSCRRFGSQGNSHRGHDAGSGPGPTDLQMPISAPQPQPVGPISAPFSGTLEVPSGPEDDGPADGVTLDRAIDSHARAEPRPPRQVLRNPHGQGRYPPGQPPGQPRLLSGRPASAIPGAEHAVYPGGARRPEPGRYQHHLPARRLAQTPGPNGSRQPRRAVLEAQYQDAVRQPDRRRLRCLRQRPGGTPNGPLLGQKRRGIRETRCR